VDLWEQPLDTLLAAASSRTEGLTAAEALDRRGVARRMRTVRTAMVRLFLRQLSSPITLILLAATLVSAIVGEVADAAIIAVIVLASAVVGFRQEYVAGRAIDDLLAQVRVRARVLRAGLEQQVAIDEVVRGDVVLLRVGDIVPADCRVLRANALQVDESMLTGESFPVLKLADGEPAAQRVGMGSHVVSGVGTVVAVDVGAATELGGISALLGDVRETSFERGLRAFGTMLMKATAVLVASIFVVNLVLHRPLLDSLLFSLALAVGLAPQLLPAIVAVSLSQGARQMATEQVIVKRLDAIEDLGAMTVLCTDKTGTLTVGHPELVHANDVLDRPSDAVFELAVINARQQRGFVNPLDDAILRRGGAPDVDIGTVLGEAPYDFERKRLSVLVDRRDGRWIITKGSLAELLTVCDTVEVDGALQSIDEHRAAIDAIIARHSDEGDRVLGVARRATTADTVEPGDERGMQMVGFLAFSDPVKADAGQELARLRDLGVRVCLITGDNRLAAAHIGRQVGLEVDRIVVGAELADADGDALIALVSQASVFAEVHPAQKEHIVAALQRAGHTVGFLGDGINDAPAIHRADVGISVDTAVDVAKQAAAVVLLDVRLDVIAGGIVSGRRTFANTLKYVNVTISANFGNMLSLAAASVFIPFLPLLPRQILLLNFLSDIPATTIASDAVDPEHVEQPQHWEIGEIRRFMVVFGAISSVFDITTFVVLRAGFHAAPEIFRSGWFVESMMTELAAMLVLRTRRAAWRSRPGTGLLVTSLGAALVTVLLPLLPVRSWFGFGVPTVRIVVVVAVIVVGYVVATEVAKRFVHVERHSRASGRVAGAPQ
jgi:Mg2+-importing ATPase